MIDGRSTILCTSINKYMVSSGFEKASILYVGRKRKEQNDDDDVVVTKIKTVKSIAGSEKDGKGKERGTIWPRVCVFLVKCTAFISHLYIVRYVRVCMYVPMYVCLGVLRSLSCPSEEWHASTFSSSPLLSCTYIHKSYFPTHA